MSDIKDGGSAFPKQPSIMKPGIGELVMEQGGMSLRDYFATTEHPPEINKKLAEALAGPAPDDIGIEYVHWIAKWQAKWKYINADAMIKAREE